MARLILFVAVFLFPALATSAPFPRPADLQTEVNFWVRIYSDVDTNSGLLHDPWNLGVVYERLALPAHASNAERQRLIDQGKARYGAALRQLAAGKRENLSAEERNALNAWPKGTSSERFRQAAGEVRFQLGRSDRFKPGLGSSGQCRAQIRRTPAKWARPEDLDGQPRVESRFNPSTYSKVAPAARWQFMPGPARQYMTVDHLMGERMDPYVSTS